MKYDSGDLDAIDLLVASRGWNLLRERFALIHQQKIKEIIQPLDAERTAELRGAIAMLNLVLEVPGILKREIRKNMTEAA